uniref:Glyoxalase-like domain-containing protein n=1 Tax=Rhodopseudomonas palustris (strain BisA53) TaxID=316055 RepID=Q07NE6_RHOP5
MSRGLDHIVHAVYDLDAAAAFYARAGFSVGMRNQHPWGTHNRIVQLQDSYIEILCVAEPDNILPHAARAFSFGAFQRDFLATGQGLSMLLMQSHDAQSDARAFAAAGFGDFDALDFAREGRLPDGSSVKLAFSLAFAVDPASKRAEFGTCQHHHPENFWNADLQRHANGAIRVEAVMLVADNPSDHHIFLGALTDVRDLHSSSLGVAARTTGGAVEILEPVTFHDEFGVSLEAEGQGMAFAGLRIAVDDIDATAALLQAAGVGFAHRGGRLVLPPAEAFGATLVFAPCGEG